MIVPTEIFNRSGDVSYIDGGALYVVFVAGATNSLCFGMVEQAASG